MFKDFKGLFLFYRNNWYLSVDWTGTLQRVMLTYTDKKIIGADAL